MTDAVYCTRPRREGSEAGLRLCKLPRQPGCAPQSPGPRRNPEHIVSAGAPRVCNCRAAAAQPHLCMDPHSHNPSWGKGPGGKKKKNDKPPPTPRAPFRPWLVRQACFGAVAYPNIFISFINSIPPYQPSGGNAGALATEVWGRAEL